MEDTKFAHKKSCNALTGAQGFSRHTSSTAAPMKNAPAAKALTVDSGSDLGAFMAPSKTPMTLSGHLTSRTAT
jgi:hypothetical protein